MVLPRASTASEGGRLLVCPGPRKCYDGRIIDLHGESQVNTQDKVSRTKAGSLDVGEQFEDERVIAAIRSEGVGVLQLLTPEELAAARADIDAIYLDSYGWADEDHPKERALFDPPPALVASFPGISRLFTHPRVIRILQAVMGKPAVPPFLQAMRIDRSLAGYGGMAPHQDGGTKPAITYERMETACFLDDTDEESGAFEYCLGSHLKNFLGAENPPLANRTKAIDEAYASGDFVPVVLKAGSMVFRVPSVWHAVRPVHRLRRKVGSRYFTRFPARRIDDAKGGLLKVVEERSTPEALEVAKSLPSELAELLSTDVAVLEPVEDLASTNAKL